jgi:hypothetical protein
MIISDWQFPLPLTFSSIGDLMAYRMIKFSSLQIDPISLNGKSVTIINLDYLSLISMDKSSILGS